MHLLFLVPLNLPVILYMWQIWPVRKSGKKKDMLEQKLNLDSKYLEEDILFQWHQNVTFWPTLNSGGRRGLTS